MHFKPQCFVSHFQVQVLQRCPFVRSISGKCNAGAKQASAAAAAQHLPQQWGLGSKLSSRCRAASAGTSPVRVMSDMFAAAQKHRWAQQPLPAGNSQAAGAAATGADADWGIAAVCAPLPGPSAGLSTDSVSQQYLQKQRSSTGLPNNMVLQQGLQEQLTSADCQADIRRLSSAAPSRSASTAAQAQQRRSRSFRRQDPQQPQQQAACSAPLRAAGEQVVAGHLSRQPSEIPHVATSRVSDGGRWATAEQHVELCSGPQQSTGSASGALGTGQQGDLIIFKCMGLCPLSSPPPPPPRAPFCVRGPPCLAVRWGLAALVMLCSAFCYL